MSTPNGRNLERQKSNAQLEGAQGMSIVDSNQIPTECIICRSSKNCETIMQEEAHAVLPGSRLCALAQGRKA